MKGVLNRIKRLNIFVTLRTLLSFSLIDIIISLYIFSLFLDREKTTC